MAVNFALLFPIMAPLTATKDAHSHHDLCLAKLASLTSGLKPLDPIFGDVELHVRLVEDPDVEPLLSGIWKRPTRVRNYSLLIIQINAENCVASIEEDISNSENLNRDLIPSDSKILSKQISADIVEHEAGNFLLLANIIYPGAISAVDGYVFVDGEHVGSTTPFYAEHLFGAVTAAANLGWPQFFSIEFNDAWEWLRCSGALADGVGTGRLGRAIAAVSHLTTTDLQATSSIGLVWILLGLEALYSKGNLGLKEQLLGKTESILGQRIEKKKIFGGVYDFRSRLLHGDVDIPLRFSPFDGVKSSKTFTTNFTEMKILHLQRYSPHCNS